MLLGLFGALAASQACGFGAAGIVIFLQNGDEGLAGFLLVGLGSLALTAAFLALAALVSAGATGRRRTAALARALVVWVALALVFDIVVLGLASFLRSGHASRLLVVSSLVNPIDAIRTGVLLGIEGTASFGSASLALLRITGGPAAVVGFVVMSLVAWIAIPVACAMRRLEHTDIA
jgi:Cu-processing system permease protein